MAAKSNTNTVKRVKKQVSRPGRHSKKKSSRSKASKNYKKLNRGQG